MTLIRWAARENHRDIEREWQWEWVFYVLSHMGLEQEVLEECFPDEGFQSFGIKQRIKLRKYCDEKNITIVDDRDGGLKIYVNIEVDGQPVQELVAEWKKCSFNLREDPEEVDPSRKIYIEIVASPWVIWEENED